MIPYIIILLGTYGLFLFIPTLYYKYRAHNLGVTISWGQAVRLKFRNTLTHDILQTASLATKENLNIDIMELEAHKLAGGNPLKVVKEIIDLKREGKILDFKLASAFDLAGKDVRIIWQENNDK